MKRLLISLFVILFFTVNAYPAWNLSHYWPYHKTTAAAPTEKTAIFASADKIKGSDIKNSSNEILGKASELVLDQKSGTIYYVILSDSKTYPVPYSAFEANGNNLMLNISKDDLSQAPSIMNIDTSRLASPDFRSKVDEFYSEKISSTEGKSMGRRAADWMKEKMQSAFSSEQKPNLIEYKDIERMDLQNTENKSLGTIKDAAIDNRQGRIAYALVDFGGFMGMRSKTAAIPWSSIMVQPSRRIARVDATPSTISGSVLPHHHISRLSDPQFARQLYDNFGDKHYSEIYGYEPGAEEKMTSDAWMPGSKYNQNFNPSNITTVNGTIESVSTYKPEKDATPGTRLKVKTSTGESVVVQVGPQDYITKEGIMFNKDSEIKVTGSKTMVGYRTVIMATEIETGGKTIKLRDEQGQPLWNFENAPQGSEKNEMKEENKEKNKEGTY